MLPRFYIPSKAWRQIGTSLLPEEFYQLEFHRHIMCSAQKIRVIQPTSINAASDIPPSVRRFDLMQRLDQQPSGPAVFHRTCSGSERIGGGGGRATDLGDGGGGGGLLLSEREGHGGGRVGGGRAGEESKGSALHGYYLGNKGLSKVDRYTIERQSGRKEGVAGSDDGKRDQILASRMFNNEAYLHISSLLNCDNVETSV